MKYRPILFSTPMVHALLTDRKSMTRRIITPQPDDSGLWNDDKFPRSIQSDLKGWNGTVIDTGESKEFKCKFGTEGDILWVREKWCNINKPEFKPDYQYFADTLDAEDYDPSEWKWKPSIHMPKKACRIFLKITDIRVERLQVITEDDAKAEGVYFYGWDDPEQDDYKNYSYNDKGNCDDWGVKTAKESFETLWEKINGPDSWSDNPWVWVISFKRVAKSEKFLS